MVLSLQPNLSVSTNDRIAAQQHLSRWMLVTAQAAVDAAVEALESALVVELEDGLPRPRVRDVGRSPDGRVVIALAPLIQDRLEVGDEDEDVPEPAPLPVLPARSPFKACTACRQALPFAAFYHRTSSSDGHTAKCKACFNAARSRP